MVFFFRKDKKKDVAPGSKNRQVWSVQSYREDPSAGKDNLQILG
jgi:hypothetical protein